MTPEEILQSLFEDSMAAGDRLEQEMREKTMAGLLQLKADMIISEDEVITPRPKRVEGIDVWDQRKLGVFPKPDGSVELFYGITLEGDDDDEISHTLEIAEAAMNAKIFFKKAIAEDDPELRREFFKTSEKFSDLHGSLQGWWELDSNGRKMAFAKIVNISEFEEHENTMAHVLAKVGVFESVSEAKRNGWNKPIELGEQFFKKKTVRLMIVKE